MAASTIGELGDDPQDGAHSEAAFPANVQGYARSRVCTNPREVDLPATVRYGKRDGAKAHLAVYTPFVGLVLVTIAAATNANAAHSLSGDQR